MHMFDEEESTEKRFEELCQSICIEGHVREDAWDKYKEVWTNFSIDGDQIQWLVCSLYECCRRSSSDSSSGQVVENVYVPLTRLLSAAKMSMVQFFHRIRRWAEMTEMCNDMRDRIEHLERQFAISSVTFRHFTRVFPVLFSPTSDEAYKEDIDHPEPSELFRFIWIMFVKTRANFPAVSDDLVNSFYLLACCLDWMLGMLVAAGQRDLINLEYRGLPRDFVVAATASSAAGGGGTNHLQGGAWRSGGAAYDSNVPPCLLRPICEDNDVNYVECKAVKEHFFRPYIVRLLEKDLMKLRPPGCVGLFEPEHFSLTLQSLNNHYEEYIIGTGDFDERIYLSPNAAEEIGSTGEQPYSESLPFMSAARGCLVDSGNSYGGSVCMTSARSDSFTNGPILGGLNTVIGMSSAETRNKNLHHLLALLANRPTGPGDTLVSIINSSQHSSLLEDEPEGSGGREDTLAQIQARVSSLCEQFTRAYRRSSSSSATADSGEQSCLEEAEASAAAHRINLAQSLYYLSQESILLNEFQRLEKAGTTSETERTRGSRGGKSDFAVRQLVACDAFHRALFACCMELVLACCDADRRFPWVLEAVGVDALEFYKVVEVLVRNIDFPRDLVKYLSQVTEYILDTCAWTSRSSIWSIIRAASRAPSVEDIFPPERLDENYNSRFTRRELFVTPGGSAPGQPPHNATSAAAFLSGALKTEASPAKQIRLTSAGVPTTGGGESTSRRGGSTVVIHDSHEDESARAAAHLLATDEMDVMGGSAEESEIESGTGGTASLHVLPTSSATRLWSSSATSGVVYPVRHDSVAIFFRHVYQLSISRLRALCDRLGLTVDVLAKIWTCFEHIVVHNTDLLKDRCLDQILLCCIYGISKVVLHRPFTFVEIVQAYRIQPQSTRDTYRRVLLGWVPISVPPSQDDETGAKETRLIEERGDLSRFYNVIFLPRNCRLLQQFAVLPAGTGAGGGGVSQAGGGGGVMTQALPPLSPMPLPSGSPMLSSSSGVHHSQHCAAEGFFPARRLANNRNVFISPVKHQVTLSPKRVTFTIGKGTSKDLIELNTVIGAAERRASMANLAMGLKRPSIGPGVTIATGGSPFTMATGDRSDSRGVSYVGQGGFESKRIDF